jgi:hypothetical protein
MRHDWKVKIIGSEVTVERPGRRTQVKRVSSRAWNALRESLRENDIFALRTVYGCSACSDNPCCTLEVADGVRTRRVQVYASSPHDRVDAGSAAELNRFSSAWNLIKQLAGLSSVKDSCR